MATSIDKKIVEMELRNRQFEAGAQKTMGTIEKLKKSLSFKGIGDSMSGLNRSIGKFDVKPMTSGLDTVITKFNALGVVGATVVSNLTSGVMSKMQQLWNTTMVEPRKFGFDEYETKLGSIQTILTNTKSKGTNLNDVSEALRTLNEYADKTIYNFADMTRNIGTFTAAGVDLETATAAIKGIANLGAGSGSTPAQVSSAMYQLSQALSSGIVTLQDWNSVVNAGMGGELFRNELIKVAKSMGKDVGDAEKSFRDSINAQSGTGWLTSDVLLKALNNFAVNEDLVAAATEVKTLTQLIDTMKESLGSGWGTTWELIIGDFEQSKKLWTGVSQAFEELIGQSSDARNELVKGWVDMGGRDMLIGSISKSWKNFLTIVNTIKDAFRAIFPATTSSDLMNYTKMFADFVDKLTPTQQTLDNISSGASYLFNIFKQGVDGLKLAGNYIKTLIQSGRGNEDLINFFASFGEWVLNVISSVDILETITSIFTNLGAAVTSGWEAIIGFDYVGGFKKALTFLKSIPAYISEILSGITDIERNALVGGVTAGGLGLFLKPILDMFRGRGSMGDVAKETVGNLGEMFEQIGKSFKAFTGSIKAQQLLNIAKAVALLAGAVFVLAMIPSDKLAQGVGAVVAMIGALTVAVKVMGSLTGAFSTLNKDGSGTSGKGQSLFGVAAALLAMAAAVGILAVAAAILSTLNLAKALGGLFAVLAMLTAFAVSMDKMVGNILKTSVAIFVIAAAINLIVLAVIPLGLIDYTIIGQGLIALGYIIALIGLFVILADRADLLKTAAGISIIAVAINILVIAIAALGLVPFPFLIQGMIALTTLMAILSVSIKQMNKSIVGAGALIGMAIALNMLVAPILLLGAIPWQQLVQGLLSVALMIGLITVAATFLNSAVVGSAALIALSASLVVLAGAVWLLATIPSDKIWTAVLALTALVGILMVAAAIAIVLSPGLIVLSVALIALGAAVLIAGMGMGVFASAMGAFAATGSAGFLVLSAGLISLAGVIPYVVKQMISGIDLILNYINDNSPLIIKAFGTILAGIIAAIPIGMTEAGKMFIAGFIDINNTIAQQAGPMAESMVAALDAMVKAVEDHWQDIMDSVARLMISLMGGISYVIREYGPQIIEDGKYIAGFFAEGFVQGLLGFWPELIASLRSWGTNVIGAIKGDYVNSFKAGKELMEGVEDGVVYTGKKLPSLISNVLDASLSGENSEMVMTPVVDFTQPNAMLTNFRTALSDTYKDAAKMEGTINRHETISVVVNGGAPIQVQGAANGQQFNSVVKSANLENELANMIRRQYRR